MTLADYGWDEQRDNDFAEHAAQGRVPGRVVRAERGQCDVVTAAGLIRVTVPPDSTGDQHAPCTGDWVALHPATAQSAATVTAILDRRSAVTRARASGTSDGQVLAANVDIVAIVVSLADPLKQSRIERLLALAWESGGMPLVILTKSDQCPDAHQKAAEVADIAPGVNVLVTSATTGEGIDDVRSAITGTVVLLGRSGAGKSSLGNRLMGADLLAINTVRDTDGKGRHTTAWRELLPLPGGGVLLDTPGLRGVGLHDVDDGLDQTFAEITDLAERCRFTDCAHQTEPGCAVLAAIEGGDLPRRRLDSYHRLQRENAHAAARTDARLRAEAKRSAKEMGRLRKSINRSHPRKM
ncbi:ribosome small subunit-dependent GTPase A [Gordonia sp. PKS22-38]|uniref:Small ribosomal subunit biogenesis GTPase RsgA n=1 Tax=Gordonia prachuapensis TaxID=3115651 RepID=A0ABU7MYG5_9ACTN|nr:ribosome small subunit-dependent GTPase A [Gordonia sp. PKS22-38]